MQAIEHMPIRSIGRCQVFPWGVCKRGLSRWQILKFSPMLECSVVEALARKMLKDHLILKRK